MSDRLDTALLALAQGRKGIVLAQAGSNPSPTTPTTPSGGGTGSQADIAAQALVHYNRAQEALQQGDWATYGSELAEMERLLRQLAGQ